MKYAFVVMIVIYLITYGCSTDEQKPETKDPKKVESITVEKNQPVAPAITGEQAAQTPVEAAPSVAAEAPAEQPAVPQQPEKVAAATEPQPPEQPGDTAQQQPTEDQGTLFVNPEDMVVMPCGRVFIRKEAPCDMPCMNMPPQDGQMMEEGPLVQEEPAMPQTMPGQPQTAPVPPQDELAAAVQKMVQATNEMVVVTRQMAKATEEMLKATKGAAGEIIDTGKENLETPDATEQPVQPVQPAEPAEPTEQAVQPQAQVPASAQSPAQAMVESLQDVVVAAKEVVDVTSKAISQTVTHQHQQ